MSARGGDGYHVADCKRRDRRAGRKRIKGRKKQGGLCPIWRGKAMSDKEEEGYVLRGEGRSCPIRRGRGLCPRWRRRRLCPIRREKVMSSLEGEYE
jgi:hypothetical protein